MELSKPTKGKPEWSERSWHTLDFQAGLGLNIQEVRNLEEILVREPNNSTVRLLLAGYYQRSVYQNDINTPAAKKYVSHLIWLIEHEPANPYLEDAFLLCGSVWFNQVRTSWRKAVKANASSVQVLINAAQFFQLASVTAAEKLWKQIIALEPNNGDHYRRLSFLYRLHASDATLPQHRKYARNCIAKFKQSLQVYSESQLDSHLLPNLRRDILEITELSKQFGLEAELTGLTDYCSKN